MTVDIPVTPDEWCMLHEGLLSLLWECGQGDKCDAARSAAVNELIDKLRDYKIKFQVSA